MTQPVALITGCSSGIGQALANVCLDEGYQVWATARDPQTLEGLVARGAMAMKLDVNDSQQVFACAERLRAEAGRLDLLVNNAGGQFFAPATGISRKGWDAVIDVNLSAIFVVTKAAYPFLKARKGSVVNISLSGVDRGSMGIAHSIAARAGVLGLMRTLALEWARDDIALNCIGPGAVLTEGLAGEAAKAMLDRLVDATPMGRATSVEEVAELVAFLATPAAHLMTGQLIQIDGAAHLGSGLHMLAA